jgi:hypothetical protein
MFGRLARNTIFGPFSAIIKKSKKSFGRLQGTKPMAYIDVDEKDIN